jgi:RNA polymerase sigma factor (sigma-70 family)
VTGGLTRKKDWVLTQRAFDRLLALLDPDRSRAAEEYERIRTRLVRIFRWSRCLSPEKLADETFDRVSRRLDEGVEIRAEEPARYFYGIARNVLKEYWTTMQEERAAEKAPPPLRDESDEARNLERREREERLECLERCLGLLPEESLELITRYYPSEGDEKKRLELAGALGVSAGTLRERAHRIRRTLESCVRDCLKRRTDA